MKRIMFIISIMFFVNNISAQSLMDLYKKGTVKLIPDETYAQHNDWDKVFETYYDTLYNRPMGDRKSIVLMPNGSVVVNHAYKNYYSLFDSNGKFVKEFGVTNHSGKQLKKTNAIQGIIGNHFFTGLDNMGKMLCFDFTGKYIKTLTLDYMAHDMIPLPDNKIAVVGWVIWKDGFRDLISIVDYNTNKEKIVWDHFSKSIRSNHRPNIAFVKNRLIATFPSSGDIFIYDVKGNLLSKDKANWKRSYISVEEQKESQRKEIEELKKRGNLEKYEGRVFVNGEKVTKNIIEIMNENLNKITEPLPLPLFLAIIKDTDDNLLFFEAPKENGANKFNVWVYDNGGKFVGQCSFECDQYDLSITPSKMIFHNGYIYSLQKLKNTTGNPLRLVRFKPI